MQEWAFPIFVYADRGYKNAIQNTLPSMGNKKLHMFLVGDRRRMEKCPKREKQSLSNKHKAQKQIEPCNEFLLMCSVALPVL